MSIYSLNKAGQAALVAAIAGVAKKNVNPEGWFEEAENAMESGSPNLVVGTQYSAFHRPVVISLQKKWFDERVTDGAGHIVDAAVAAQLMDEETREAMHGARLYADEQDFMTEYCERHEEKFGEIFVCA